jgi:polyphosphate kinase
MSDKRLKKAVIEKIMLPALQDTTKARVLLPTGKYVFNRKVCNEKHFNYQEWLMENSVTTYKKTPKRGKK